MVTVAVVTVKKWTLTPLSLHDLNKYCSFALVAMLATASRAWFSPGCQVKVIGVTLTSPSTLT